MKKNKYTEPTDYIPKEIRKELGLGEYNTDENEKEIKDDPIRDAIKKK